MKIIKKLFLGALCAGLLSVPSTLDKVEAADTTVYLKPNSNWTQSNAWFSIYTWGGSAGEKWIKMTDNDGDGYYEGVMPNGYSNMIYCRMNSGSSSTGWSNVWNQTSDLTLPINGNNCYTVAEGAWSKGSGSWSKYTYKVPDYYLMGTMSDWATGKKMSENNGVYTVTLEDVAVGEQSFKIKSGDNWYGHSQITVNGITVKNDVDDNCVFTSEGGNYTFTYTTSSKTLNVTHESYADLNKDLASLFTKYYNSGTYTRHTVVNMNLEKEDVKADVKKFFHAGATTLERTTYFKGDALWMTNEEGTYSYYGTKDGNMTGGRVSSLEETSDSIAVRDTTMEDYYYTMDDVKTTTDVKWTKDGNVYTNRYDQSKTTARLDNAQAEKIANEYNFNQFNEYLVKLLNNSFFASATVESFENNVAKVALNIGTYDISTEEESEVLTTIFDGIKESNSVILEVTYAETGVTNIKVTIDKDVVSTIELQLFGTAQGELPIEFPDFSSYAK